MGSGASADVLGAVSKASTAELAASFDSLDEEARSKVLAAFAKAESEVSVKGAAVPAEKSAAASAIGGAFAALGSAAKSSAAPSAAAAASTEEDGSAPERLCEGKDTCVGDIPEEWGWPKSPFEAEDLKEFVYNETAPTSDEKWSEALEKRATCVQEHTAEKLFANVLLNKEHTGDAPRNYDIDPNCYKKGRWYRFLNHSGECYVFVHNYTRNIVSTRPDNFTELTEEEKKRLKKLGTYIKELPREIERIYDKIKKIPIVYGSPDTCEALKVFFEYDKNHTLLDCKNLKKVNSKALEDSRKAIVNSMKLGTTLAIYLTDNIPELVEKICVGKNRDTFPMQVFRYGMLDTDMVKEKIYRDEDKEAGFCHVRDHFRICLILPYDTMELMHSSMRKQELPSKIPDFDAMEEVKVYNDDDKRKMLEMMQKG